MQIFSKSKKSKIVFGRAPPRTPLGQLTTLPKSPRLGRKKLPQKPSPFPRRLLHLDSLIFCFPVFLVDYDLIVKIIVNSKPISKCTPEFLVLPHQGFRIRISVEPEMVVFQPVLNLPEKSSAFRITC